MFKTETTKPTILMCFHTYNTDVFYPTQWIKRGNEEMVAEVDLKASSNFEILIFMSRCNYTGTDKLHQLQENNYIN